MKDEIILSAISFLQRYLSKFTIWEGERLIENIFMNWGQAIVVEETVDQLSFTSEYQFLGHWPEKKVPSSVILGKLPDQSDRSKERKIIDALAYEWIYRMYPYSDKVSGDEVERFESIAENQKPDENTIVAHSLEVVKKFSLDDALDYFAVLGAEWARKGYIDKSFHPTKAGYSLTDGTSINDWVTHFVLWGFAEDFQVSL
jgi:hypothetical protein